MLRKNKYTFTLLLICCLSMRAFAQQTPHFTQYLFNMYGVNPAFGSSLTCLDFRMGSRLQWVGFDGGPRTYFASVVKPFQTASYRMDKHSVGAYVARDYTGPTNRLYVKLSYSYQLKLKKGLSAAVGIFGGVQQYVIRPYTYDPAIVAERGFHYPDIMPGLLLYSSRFFLSLSAEQVYPMKLKVSRSSKLVNHYYAAMGYKYDLGAGYSMLYSGLLKFAPVSPPSLDLTATYETPSYSLGGAYRVGEAVSAIVKFKVLGMFTIGYAFDFPLNKIRSTYATGHELMIGMSRCKGENELNSVTCPGFK